MTTESEREQGYRDGIVDQRLAGFDHHFAEINGSIAKTAATLGLLLTGQESLRTELAIFRSLLPQVEELRTDAIGTKSVARALREDSAARRAKADDWRSQVSWTLAIPLTLITLIGGILALAKVLG